MGIDPSEPFDPETAALIHRKAVKLRRHRAFANETIADLEQELAVQFLPRRAKFNPARGSPLAFADRVLTNLVRNLIEKRCAKKRDGRRESSLEAPDTLIGPDEKTRADLHIDLRDANAALPPSLRAIAADLMVLSHAEIARKYQLTRGALRHRMEQIAKHLSEKNLRPNNQPAKKPGS